MSASGRKRLYKLARISANGCDFDIMLDERPIRTPAGRTLTVPTEALAEAIAQEWNAQGEMIAAAGLPLTRLANTAIDGVAGREADVASDIVAYAATDLVCYRADYPAELEARQAALWDPILSFIRSHYHATFAISHGVRHVAQPGASLQAIEGVVSRLDPFALAALHVMTSLTGSALITLAHVGGFLDAESAWRAAHVDEDWQMATWGEDFEASVRRHKRFSDFECASRFFILSRRPPPA